LAPVDRKISQAKKKNRRYGQRGKNGVNCRKGLVMVAPLESRKTEKKEEKRKKWPFEKSWAGGGKKKKNRIGPATPRKARNILQNWSPETEGKRIKQQQQEREIIKKNEVRRVGLRSVGR